MNRLTLLIVCVATVAANAATVCPGRPRRLAVSENGVPVFAELADAPEPWFHSSGWDMLRLTVRGVDAPQEDVRVGMEISGYTIRMR